MDKSPTVSQLRVTPEAIERAAGVVEDGGLVVYPTDTVYGLGCDPMDQEAVHRVFRVKQRGDDSLPVLFSSLEEVREYCALGEVGEKLAEEFWPGKVTLVAKAKREMPAALNRETVAVRVPGLDSTVKLIAVCGGKLVGTSANLSGLAPATDVDRAISQLGSEVDLYLDGGPSSDTPSTVVDVTEEGVRILREGAVSLREIRKKTGLEG